MNGIFTLDNPRGFWIISAAVAVVGTAGIIPFLGEYPWLVCVPIAVGGAATVAAEFFISPGAFSPIPTKDSTRPTRPQRVGSAV
jgi:hypothetical protein